MQRTCVRKIKRSVTLFVQFITKVFSAHRFFRVLRNSLFRIFEFCEIRFSEQTTFTQKTKRSKIFARKELAPFSQHSLRSSDGSGASGSSFPESRSTSIAHFSSVIQIFLICNQISSCYFIDCQFINQ